MSKPPEHHKSFVDHDNQTRIVCPSCGISKTLSVENFRHRQHQLRARCTCSHVFSIQLEFRRHHRKATDIEAVYGADRGSGRGGKVKIRNLSLSGASFEMVNGHNMEVGQKGILAFTLDDRKKTTLNKQVVVRTVKDDVIGCEFIEDRAFQKELGFYLLP